MGHGGSRGRTACGRRLVLIALLALAATAGRAAAGTSSLVDPALLNANPLSTQQVIVQADSVQAAAAAVTAVGGQIRRRLSIIDGVAADVPAAALQTLAAAPGVGHVSLDADVGGSALAASDPSLWQASADVPPLWGSGVAPAPPTPTIAVIDSGVDASRAADFGARVVTQVNLSSRDPGGTGDDFGHGTMVAGIAAGASSSYPGVAPLSNIVSIRTADANDQSLVSDVVAAAQWVLDNHAAYGIGVVNLSLLSSNPSSFINDPLDQALEQLWFNGIVVVAAAGNIGGPVRMDYAPASDPFIIVVGAAETQGTADTSDDTVASFSAYGHGWDGFARPDLVAPGRYIVAPSPPAGALTAQYPSNVVAPGYLRLSGTSFASPVVAGAAAQLLARHPGWTPDDVKGALMQTAQQVSP